MICLFPADSFEFLQVFGHCRDKKHFWSSNCARLYKKKPIPFMRVPVCLCLGRSHVLNNQQSLKTLTKPEAVLTD